MEKEKLNGFYQEKLLQMDRDIAYLNKLRTSRAAWITRFKVAAVLSCILFVCLFYIHSLSVQRTENLIERSKLMQPAGSARFSESGQMIGISYNEVEKFDEFVIIQP
jgi:hypothetical protein